MIARVEGVQHRKRVVTCATVMLDAGCASQMSVLESSNDVSIAEHSQTRGTDQNTPSSLRLSPRSSNTHIHAPPRMSGAPRTVHTAMRYALRDDLCDMCWERRWAAEHMLAEVKRHHIAAALGDGGIIFLLVLSSCHSDTRV